MLWYKGIRYTAKYVRFNLLFQCPAIGHFVFNRLKLCKHPTRLEVEVTTRCNLKCVMCEHTYWTQNPIDMSFDDFKRLVDQFPKIDWMGLTGIGTAFLNKDYLRMMRYVKEKRNPYIEIYDSCHMLDERIARELVDIGLDRLFVSMDAATADTYNQIRVNASYDRVLDNIRGLVRARREARKGYPEINFHYIVSNLNKHEMDDFVRLVHSLDLGRTVHIAFTLILHDFAEIKGLVPDLSDEEIDETTALAKTLGIRLTWNKNTRTLEPVGRCVEWTMPFIFADGSVIPCCAGNEANMRQWQCDNSLGNLFAQDFHEIWNGPAYDELRKRIWKNRMPGPCANCTIYRS